MTTPNNTETTSTGRPPAGSGPDGTATSRGETLARRLSLLAAVILVGLSAGFFFTYEASVTLGLAQVDDQTYVTTFQAINDTIRNAAFGIVFFGAVPAIAAALIIHRRADTITRALLAGGLALYLACVGVTFAGNVPLNDELAETTVVTESSAAAARAEFEADWNRLNLIRTVAVIVSFGLVAGAQNRRAQFV